MLIKSKKYDQNTQSLKAVGIKGVTWYRITNLPKDEPNVAEIKPEKAIVKKTLEERIEALEKLSVILK